MERTSMRMCVDKITVTNLYMALALLSDSSQESAIPSWEFSDLLHPFTMRAYL